MMHNPSSRINWAEVTRLALIRLQDALVPLQTHLTTRKNGGYRTEAGVDIDRLYGATICLAGHELDFSTEEFCNRIVDSTVSAIAEKIKQDAGDDLLGSMLEVIEMELPVGFIASERRTAPEKLSVRITFSIDPIEHKGEPVEGCIEHYDFVSDRKYLIAPPFTYVFRIDLLGAVVKKTALQAA